MIVPAIDMSAVRAATYNRVSDLTTEASILENQIALTREYVTLKGWTLVKEHTEAVTSKGITPVLETVLKSAEAKEIDVVVFSALSRMTRGGHVIGGIIFNRLFAAGCGWHFVQNQVLNYDSTVPVYIRNIVMTIYAELDKEYRENISRATKRKLDLLREQGIVGGAGKHKLPCRCKAHRGRRP